MVSTTPIGSLVTIGQYLAAVLGTFVGEVGLGAYAVVMHGFGPNYLLNWLTTESSYRLDGCMMDRRAISQKPERLHQWIYGSVPALS
ncbi:hypothetical protein BGX38DRAFT_1178034 [Terfezia claveryi]|nr:hypothetical protein BGX38DRAFT_1178034 [Terfezia claveryi]